MANYKTSWVQRLIEGAWQKTFAFAHAKTVYTDFANKKTLADKLSEIDTEIGNKANKTELPTELPANGGNSATVNGHTVKSDVPENAIFTDTVYDYSALLGYDIYNLVSLKDATYPANKTWLVKDFIAPFDGYVFFMVQTDATSGAFTQVLREDGVLVSDNQRDIADFNTWGEAYYYQICKGKTYHFESYNNTATAFNKVMLCIRKKFENPTEYVPYAPSNIELAEEKADKTETTVNLLNPTLETTTRNGVTCTNNGDGTYTFKGTATENIEFQIAILTLKPGQYKYFGSRAYVRKTDMTWVKSVKTGDIVSITEDNPVLESVVYIYKGDSIDKTIPFMITTNLNATYDDFVPYTGDSGSLNGDVAEKAPKKNPVFTGSISLGRRDADVGENSTAEGSNTSASGKHSHAEGWHTTASGKASHAEGWNTESLYCQHAGGHFNNTTTATDSEITGTGTGTSFVIGNGTSSARSNAFRVDDNGTPYSKAGLNTTGADYAEFFEWEDGNENNEDRRGYFVTLDGKNIKIANEGDWILGIVSGFPAIIGNGDEEWKGRYIFDDFGCPVIEEFEYEEEEYETITNDDGEEEVITKKVKKTGTKWKEVPEYDSTQPYTGRMQRKEWAAIGMLGVLSVRDDGSCKVNGFCKLADGGIATDSDTGYRVVKRVTDNIVEVIFK